MFLLKLDNISWYLSQFQKRKAWHEHELKVIHGNTYSLRISSSSRLGFNWLDNSSNFPTVRITVSNLGAISLYSDLDLVLLESSEVLSCIQPEFRFCLVWTMFKYFKGIFKTCDISRQNLDSWLFFKKRNIKQHRGLHSYREIINRTWRQPPSLNAHAPYRTLYPAWFSCLCHLSGPT